MSSAVVAQTPSCLATENAVLVERLLRAGAVIYGKTNVPLMLQDAQSYNEIYRTTNNPWDKERGPGGSSGGEAAAVAAGLSALGAGSDIAGSLRNPAHYCGIDAHKPSWGLIPTHGHSPTGLSSRLTSRWSARWREMPWISLWRCRSLSDRMGRKRLLGGSNCRRRATAGLASFASRYCASRPSARSMRASASASMRRPPR